MIEEQRKRKEKLQKLEKDYISGLNYIDCSTRAKSLRPLYIESLKKIREELLELESLKEKEETGKTK